MREGTSHGSAVLSVFSPDHARQSPVACPLLTLPPVPSVRMHRPVRTLPLTGTRRPTRDRATTGPRVTDAGIGRTPSRSQVPRMVLESALRPLSPDCEAESASLSADLVRKLPPRGSSRHAPTALGSSPGVRMNEFGPQSAAHAHSFRSTGPSRGVARPTTTCCVGWAATSPPTASTAPGPLTR